MILFYATKGTGETENRQKSTSAETAVALMAHSVVTSGLDFGESPVPVWTKEKRALFTSRLRSAHVTISYAIARCVTNTLIYV